MVPREVEKSRDHLKETKTTRKTTNEGFALLRSFYGGTSQNPKHVPGMVSGNCGRVLDSGTYFVFGVVFWILGSFLDSGNCFVLPKSHHIITRNDLR